MRPLHLALLSLLALVPLGCTPPAQQQSSNRSSDRPSESRYDARDRRDRNSPYEDRNSRYEERDRRDRQDDDLPSDTRTANTTRIPRGRPRTSAPGTFDFYLLTLSWSPEFCATHTGAAECAAHPGFILHGLWPQNTDATYPEHCSDAPGPADPSQYSDIFPDQGLLEHEWSTHGTCSGLAPDAYFQLARRAFQSVHTPPALNTLTQQTSEPPSQILSAFAAINAGIPPTSLALSCGNNYLTAVQVCLDKNLNAFACQVRTCHANTVRIVPRNGGN